MRHLRSRASLCALLSAAALIAGSAVKADIIPLFNAATPVSGGCAFTYDVNIADGSRVNTGDYFTIYDFNGLVSGSEVAPIDWSISEQLTGITPAGVDPSAFSGDSAGVLNITFTYTGAPTLFGPTVVGGPAAFGATSSTCITTGLGTYASNAHKNNPGKPDDNTVQANGGFTVTPAAIPESSSLMLLVPGLVPLSIMLRRRVRKA
jgi:hypothetical protein